MLCINMFCLCNDKRVQGLALFLTQGILFDVSPVTVLFIFCILFVHQCAVVTFSPSF